MGWLFVPWIAQIGSKQVAERPIGRNQGWVIEQLIPWFGSVDYSIVSGIT